MRRRGPFVVVVLLAAVASTVLWVTLGLEGADSVIAILANWVTILSAVVVALGVAVNQQRSREYLVGPSEPGTDAVIAAMTDVLAGETLKVLQRNDTIREREISGRVEVDWGSTKRTVQSRWGQIRGNPLQQEMLHLAGSGDGILDTYRRIPSGRLVILGGQGAGKSVLAERLVRMLLDAREKPGLGDRQRSDPAPVILPLADWIPSREALHHWMARRLRRDFPGLEHRGGLVGVADLLERNAVLPVLDGLDEMPAAHRSVAIKKINEAYVSREEHGFVVTSRGDLYEQAVAGADALKGAAVIELRPVPAAAVAEYLTGSASLLERAERWEPVARAMTADPDGPLAAALSTPLMAWLAAVVHGRTDGRPDKLIEVAAQGPADGARARVTAHLLDSFLSSVYPEGPVGAGDRDRWTAEEAGRWLRTMTRAASRAGTQGLSWWAVGRTVPVPVLGGLTGLLVGLVCGLSVLSGQAWISGGTVLGLAVGVGATVTAVLQVGEGRELLGFDRFGRTAAERRAGGWFGRVVVELAIVLGGAPPQGESSRRHLRRATLGAGIGAVVGLAAGAAFAALASRPDSVVLQVLDGLALGAAYGLAIAVISALVGPEPADIEWRPFRRFGISAYRFAVGALFGLALGTAYGLARASGAPGLDAAIQASSFGLTTGVAFGVVAATSAWFGSPADVEATTPGSALGADRSAAIIRSCTSGLVTAVAGCAALAAARQGGLFSLDALRFAVPAGAALGVMITAAALLLTPWGRFTLARTWWAARGELPWAWTRFMDDAYSRGVLRQSGASYVLRNAYLYEALAPSTTRTAASDSAVVTGSDPAAGAG